MECGHSTVPGWRWRRSMPPWKRRVEPYSRPLDGEAPKIDVAVGYSKANASPIPKLFLSRLEQLRALWHGYAIAVSIRQDAPLPGVDTPEDLERARALFDRESHKR